MLTIHTALRDRQALRSTISDLVALCASALICIVEFADPHFFVSMHLEPAFAHLLAGGASVLVFLLSLVALKIDWKQRTEIHSHACGLLSELKAEIGTQLRLNGDDSREAARLSARATELVHRLPRIPERQFHTLKVLHRRKVQLGQMSKENPNSPIWLLRLILWWRGLLQPFAHRNR